MELIVSVEAFGRKSQGARPVPLTLMKGITALLAKLTNAEHQSVQKK